MLHWLWTLQCAQALCLNFSNPVLASDHCVTICYYFKISRLLVFRCGKAASLLALVHCLMFSLHCSHLILTFFQINYCEVWFSQRADLPVCVQTAGSSNSLSFVVLSSLFFLFYFFCCSYCKITVLTVTFMHSHCL